MSKVNPNSWPLVPDLTGKDGWNKSRSVIPTAEDVLVCCIIAFKSKGDRLEDINEIFKNTNFPFTTENVIKLYDWITDILMREGFTGGLNSTGVTSAIARVIHKTVSKEEKYPTWNLFDLAREIQSNALFTDYSGWFDKTPSE